MLKYLLLGGCCSIGCAHKIKGFYKVVSVFIYILKVVFYGIFCVNICFPFCDVIRIMINGKGICESRRNFVFSIKPTKESVSGVSRCSNCYFLVVKIGATVCYTTAEGVICFCGYSVGISCVIHLKHEASVSGNVSAYRAFGFIKRKVFEYLYFCGYDSICCAVKLYTFCHSITTSDVFKVVFYGIFCVNICFPASTDISVFCYGGGKVIIPRSKSITYSYNFRCFNKRIFLNSYAINRCSTIGIKGYLIHRSAPYCYDINVGRLVIYVFGNVNGIIANVKRQRFCCYYISAVKLIRYNVRCTANGYDFSNKRVKFSII